VGENLGSFMQRFHGSVAKLVNDNLSSRVLPFWKTRSNRDYFDGCIRDENQLRRAYRYTIKQSVRAGIVRDWREYSNTHVDVSIEDVIKRARSLKVYLEEVPYPRYGKHGR
jgi:hypothetical protein